MRETSLPMGFLFLCFTDDVTRTSFHVIFLFFFSFLFCLLFFFWSFVCLSDSFFLSVWFSVVFVLEFAETMASEKPCYIEKKTVEDAVKALRQVLEKDAKSGRKPQGNVQLFEERGMFFVTLALHRPPTHVDKMPLTMFVPALTRTHTHVAADRDRRESHSFLFFS